MDRNQPTGFLKHALMILIVLVIWAIASNGDYQDAKQDECAGKSSPELIVIYDADLDSCVALTQTKEK